MADASEQSFQLRATCNHENGAIVGPHQAAAEPNELAEVGNFFVEVGEGGFEGFAMVGMSGGGEIVDDAGARELKILARLFAHELFGSFRSRTRFFFRGFRRFDLRFDVLAFPAACHVTSVTQNGAIRGRIRTKIARRISGTGGAALGQNGESGTQYGTDGGFSDAGKMLSENAMIGESGVFAGPVDA